MNIILTIATVILSFTLVGGSILLMMRNSFNLAFAIGTAMTFFGLWVSLFETIHFSSNFLPGSYQEFGADSLSFILVLGGCIIQVANSPTKSTRVKI